MSETFDKNLHLQPSFTAFPGRGPKPDYCCSSKSDKGHVVSFNAFVTEYGHHVCHMYHCPDCWEHMVLSGVFHAIGYLRAVQYLHPGTAIYQLRYTFRDQDSITKDSIGKVIKKLKIFIKGFRGIYGGVYILHNNQVKKFVEDRINKCYCADYGESLTRTELYRVASDLPYLHHIGFTNFKDYREAFETLWHLHVFVIADHFPSELYLHGNMKKSIAKLLTGGPHKRFSLILTKSTGVQHLPTHRPDGTPCHWYTGTFDHSYNGADLARSLYYCYSHCTISNTPGLEFHVLRPFGDCYDIHDLDFIQDGYTFYRDPYTKKSYVARFDPSVCDPRVLDALETLQQAFPSTHRRGKFIYPGYEEIPTINEDLPAKEQYEPTLTRINVQVFKLHTLYKDGIRIPADNAEFTYKRQDEFIDLLKQLESIGIIPTDFTIKYSDSVRKAFNIWNERCLDPKLRAKDRLLYTTDFEGFEEFEKAELSVNLGYISKAVAYKPPTGLDFEKINVLLTVVSDTLHQIAHAELPLERTKQLFDLSLHKDLQEYAVEPYYRKAQKEDPFYDDFIRFHDRLTGEHSN